MCSYYELWMPLPDSTRVQVYSVVCWFMEKKLIVTLVSCFVSGGHEECAPYEVWFVFLPIYLTDYYRLFDITWKDASLVAYFKWKYKMFLVLTVHILLDTSFVFSVSVLCSQIFTLELNLLAKICLMHTLSIMKCFLSKNIYYCYFSTRNFYR